MQEDIILIREKRKNIVLIFLCTLFIVVISYLMLNSIANKVIATVEDARLEYRPIVDNLNASAGVAGAGVKEIAQSGKAVIEKFPETLSTSISDAKAEYGASQKKVVGEYNSLKSAIEIDYQQLKGELSQLKGDLRKDVDWIKTELAEWRVLITWIAFAFGLILTLMSIQEILENTRWFTSLIIDFFKRKKEKGSQ